MYALKRTTAVILTVLFVLSGLPAVLASDNVFLPPPPQEEGAPPVGAEKELPPVGGGGEEAPLLPEGGVMATGLFVPLEAPAVIHDTLQNGGFELSGETPVGWTAVGDTILGGIAIESNTEGYVFRGQRALRVSATGGMQVGAVSDPVQVTPGQAYLLNAHTRTVSGTMQIAVTFYTAEGIQSGVPTVYAAPGNGWKHITTNTSGVLPAVAPADAAYATVSLLVTPIAGQNEADACFDNIRLTALTTSMGLINPGFEAGTMDVSTGDPMGFSSWEWGYGYYGAQTLVTYPVKSGTYSLKQTTVNRQYSNQTIRTPLVSVVPGKEYDFFVYVYQESGAQPYVTFEYYNENGALFGAVPPQVSSTRQNQWEKLGARATIPADVAYMTMTVQQVGGSMAGVYYVDDFGIAEVQVPVVTIDPALKNPLFEDGVQGMLPENWTKIGDSGAAVLADNGDGTKSLELTYTDGAHGVKSNRFAVEGGTFYMMSTRYINTTGTKQKVILNFYAADNTPLAANFWHGANNIELTTDGDNQGLFRPASGYVLAPEGAVSADIVIEQNAQAGGALRIDALDFAAAAPGVGLSTGGFEGIGSNACGYPSGYGAHSWTSAAAATVQSETVYAGSSALKMDMSFVTDAGKRGGVLTPLVAVEPGEAYAFSAQIYNTGDKKLALYCYWITNGGGQVLSQYPASGKMGEWEFVTTGPINAPDNAVAAAIMLYQSGGISYADDVSIKKEQRVVYSPVLLNPGFEEGLHTDNTVRDWVKYNAAGNVATVATDRVHSGIYAARLSSSESGGNGLRSAPVAVEPNVMYRGAGMFYNESGTSDLYLEFWNEYGTRIGVKTYAVTRTNAWIEVNVEEVAPATAVYATLLIYQSSNNHGVVYADDLSVAVYTPPDEEIRPFTPIVDGHPKVAFTAADIPALRAKAQDGDKAAVGVSGKDVADQILAQADRYLAETEIVHHFDNVYGQPRVTITLPVPPTGLDVSTLSPAIPSGYSNFPFWTAISRGLEDRMEILSIAYVLTGNTQYADRAIAYAVAMTTWASWHDPRDTAVNTNLDTAHILFGVLSVYDMLYDRLTPEQQAAIRTAMMSKALEPLFVDAKTKVDHNIQALRNAALTSGALGLMGDVDAAITNKYLTRATEFFTWYLDERRDSGNQEGYGYTSYALENMIDAFEQLARVTGDQSFVNNAWLNDDLTRWVAAFTAPASYTLPQVSNYDGTKGFYQTFSVLANNGNGLAGWYIVNAKPLGSVLLTKQFLYLNKNMPVTEPAQLIGNTTLNENVSWAALRTGWGATDTIMGLIANSSALGHNHYDQNSFVLATNGDWIAADPGYSNFYYDEEWNWKSKVGHNTMLVDWVKDTQTGTQIYKGGGNITPKLAADTFGYVVGHASAPYGDLLSRYDRHALMVNHAQRPYYLLFDDLASSRPRTFTWSLYSGVWDNLAVDGHTLGSVESSQTGNAISMKKGINTLYTQFVSDAPLQIDTGMYKASYGPYIHVSNTEKASVQQFLAVMNTYTPGIAIPAASFQASQQLSPDTTGALSVGSALFRGETGAGATVTWTFHVPENGEFDITLIMPGSYWYGIYQASIDGVPIGNPYDGYVPYPQITSGNYNELGSMTLSSGQHTLTMTCLGTNSEPERTPENIKYLTAVTSILLTPAGGDPAADAPVEVTETYDTADTLGAKIRYSAQAQDIMLFSRMDGGMSGGGLEGDGTQAGVLGVNAAGTFAGYTLTGGTQLSYEGRVLLFAGASINALVEFGHNGHVSVLSDTQTATQLSVYVGQNVDVTGIGGISRFSYNPATGLLSFDVSPGQTTAAFRTAPRGTDPEPAPTSETGADDEVGGPVITMPGAVSGGRVTLSADGKTVLMIPDDGYIVDDVRIDGISVGALTSYTFQDTRNHRVEAAFKRRTEAHPANALTDIRGHWAEEAIRDAVARGWFNGVGADRFAPEQTMNRAMLVTVLYRMSGEPAFAGEAHFSDVADGVWYADAVAWAAGQGITAGVGGGRFAPDDDLSREQIAKLLYEYAKYRGYIVHSGAALTFADAHEVADWAEEAIKWAVDTELLQGRGANRLAPGDKATRAEVATMLVRFAKLLG